MSRTQRQLTGELGERAARAMLEAKGFLFISANWHCPIGELDLVMQDHDEIAFIEVKTRRGELSGRAEDSIGRTKSASLLAAAEWYIDHHSEHSLRIWRIDLVAITLDSGGHLLRMAHIENAIVSE